MQQRVWLNIIVLVLFASSFAAAQAGRRAPVGSDNGGSIVPVFARKTATPDAPVKPENLALYENGVEQRVKNFAFDPSPSRIVLLVDNSQTLRTEVDVMKQAAQNFAYEIFDGDQIFIAAYDEKAEIVQDWTDDPKKIEAGLKTFRKKGNPYLFDSLGDTLEQIVRPLMPGTTKTAVVIISDGLDRGSKIDFDKILAAYQQANVTIYALQLEDRTGGAYRRNSPKPEQVIQKLTEGTGGQVFDFNDAGKAAKTICDELRKNRYLLVYQSTSGPSLDARRLFLTGDEGMTFRAKTFQPPTIK